MPEIGVTLREARMRAGIDIAEVESRTKIRAKYLRALENEEWSLLPGTTFVKSFLRTYAETLGLDAKLLVEEYKFRHEPYEVGGGQHGPGGRGRRGRRIAGRGTGRGGGGAFGPPRRTSLLPLLLLVVIVAGAIFAVVQLGKSEDETPPAATTAPRTETAPQTASATDAAEEKRRRSVVRLRITAPRTEAASICVVDAKGKVVANTLNLKAGTRTETLRSRQFDVALSGGVVVRDGSKRLRLKADDKNVVAYRITKGKNRRLSDARKPSCS
jgi:hypothetical protein